MTVGISLDTAPTHSAAIVWTDEKPVINYHFKSSDWLQAVYDILDVFEHYDFDWVAIEGNYYNKNAKVFADLNKILGVVQWFCNHYKVKPIPCFVGTTAEIDSACGITPGLTRKERKQETENLATKLYYEDLVEDECDAIAIGIWGWGKFKEYQILQNGLDMSE